MSKLKWVLYIVVIKTVVAHNRTLKLNNDDSLNNFKFKLQNSLSDYTLYLTKYLEKFNDKHLGRTYLGRLIRYNDMKPRIEDLSSSTNRGAAHKFSAILPLVFHVGATSTWMILTSILTAKSVLIGLTLLIFKIAVSSAKLSAYFTSLKHHQSHHHDHHHDTWGHHDHHHDTWGHNHDWGHHHEYDHERNLKDFELFDSYNPHWHHEHSVPWPTSKHHYKTIPEYFKTSDEFDDMNNH